MNILVIILIAISLPDPTPAGKPPLGLLDVLMYTCTDVMPSLDHLNFFNSGFGELRMDLLPVCNYVIKEADILRGFDATKFCNFLVDYLQLGELMHSNGPEGPLPGLLDSLYRQIEITPRYRVAANVIQNLYGMDLEDPTTICSHAQLLFQPSLRKLFVDFVGEYFTELIIVIPELESICHDWKGYFASLGVPDSSPYQRLVGSILDIISDIVGYEILEDMCQIYEEIFSKELHEARRTSTQNARRLFSEMLASKMRNILLDEPSGTSQKFGRSRQTPMDKKIEL